MIACSAALAPPASNVIASMTQAAILIVK